MTIFSPERFSPGWCASYGDCFAEVLLNDDVGARSAQPRLALREQRVFPDGCWGLNMFGTKRLCVSVVQFRDGPGPFFSFCAALLFDVSSAMVGRCCPGSQYRLPPAPRLRADFAERLTEPNQPARDCGVSQVCLSWKSLVFFLIADHFFSVIPAGIVGSVPAVFRCGVAPDRWARGLVIGSVSDFGLGRSRRSWR